MDVFDALAAHGEIGEQVIDVLYGDAEEIRKGLVRELVRIEEDEDVDKNGACKSRLSPSRTS